MKASRWIVILGATCLIAGGLANPAQQQEEPAPWQSQNQATMTAVAIEQQATFSAQQATESANTPTAPTGSSPSLTDAAQAVFVQINQERASQGLPALQIATALIKSAHAHNLVMQAANQLSHQLPGEADLGTRISAQGLTWTSAAENIGDSFGDATQVAVGLNQLMFDEKPPDDGHRENILSGNTLIGIDVISNPGNAQIWLTEDFAKT